MDPGTGDGGPVRRSDLQDRRPGADTRVRRHRVGPGRIAALRGGTGRVGRPREGRAHARACGSTAGSAKAPFDTVEPADTERLAAAVIPGAPRRDRSPPTTSATSCTGSPGLGRFRVERVPSARLRRLSCSAGCCRASPASRRSASRRRSPTLASAAARARPRDRPRRLGQDRDAGGDGRPRRTPPRGPHRDHRGPGRGAARRQALDRRSSAKSAPTRRRAVSGLEHSLRQDPDVIVLGELPTRPTPPGRCSRRPRSDTSCSPPCRR